MHSTTQRTMTREEVKQQLEKSPLEWKEEEILHVESYHSTKSKVKYMLFEYRIIRAPGKIPFMLYLYCVNKKFTPSLSFCLPLRQLFGKEPLQKLKDFAKEHRLDLSCRLLGASVSEKSLVSDKAWKMLNEIPLCLQEQAETMEQEKTGLFW